MFAIVAVMLAVAIPGAAHADVGVSVKPEIYDDVRGVRFGSFVFVPRLSIQGGYDSNVFRESSEEIPEWGAKLVFTPGFSLKNPNPSWVRLTWDAQVGFNIWFADSKAVKNQGLIIAATGLRADFLPKSLVGLYVADDYKRLTQPTNYSTSDTYDRNVNVAAVGVQFRPGGALDLDLAYSFGLNMFDSHAELDQFYHSTRFLLLWNFFPSTSFVVDVDWRYSYWATNVVGVRADSMPLRAKVGVRGYVTRKLAMSFMAGYGQGFFKQGTDVQTFIGELSFAYKPFTNLLVELGYDRDFTDSYYARWYTADSVHLKLDVKFKNRYGLSVFMKYAYLMYAGYSPSAAEIAARGYTDIVVSQAERRDHMLSAGMAVDIQILRYLDFRVRYDFESSLTDFTSTMRWGADSEQIEYGKYMAHKLMGEFRVMY
jgi:hypothetical protein